MSRKPIDLLLDGAVRADEAISRKVAWYPKARARSVLDPVLRLPLRGFEVVTRDERLRAIRERRKLATGRRGSSVAIGIRTPVERHLQALRERRKRAAGRGSSVAIDVRTPIGRHLQACLLHLAAMIEAGRKHP